MTVARLLYTSLARPSDHQQARWVKCLPKDPTTDTDEAGVQTSNPMISRQNPTTQAAVTPYQNTFEKCSLTNRETSADAKTHHATTRTQYVTPVITKANRGSQNGMPAVKHNTCRQKGMQGAHVFQIHTLYTHYAEEIALYIYNWKVKHYKHMAVSFTGIHSVHFICHT